MAKISINRNLFKNIFHSKKQAANGKRKRSWNLKNVKRLYLWLAAINLCCLALMAVCLGRYSVYDDLLPSQQAAQRWQGDSEQRFAQVSLFFPSGGGPSENDIAAFRQTLDNKLLEASLTAPENGALWTDAYSATSKLNVASDKATANVIAIGVAGDYFLFHPLQLRHGSYIWGDDLMKDRVVIDEELAWRLFGGVEVAGLTLTIDGNPYWIAGVVSREKDALSRLAMDEEQPYIFVDYSVLAAKETGIGCYELVAPDPVGGFALSIVEEGFSADNGVPVENSSRYTLGNIWRMFTDWQSLLMNKDGVALPYWENAARLCAAYRLIYFLCILLLAIFPAVCILVILIKQYIKLIRRYQKWRAARREYD